MLVDIINGTQGTRKQIKVLPNLLRMQKEVGKYSSTNHRQTFLEREFEVFQSDRRGRSVVFFVRVLDPSSTDEGVPSRFFCCCNETIRSASFRGAHRLVVWEWGIRKTSGKFQECAKKSRKWSCLPEAFLKFSSMAHNYYLPHFEKALIIFNKTCN